MKTRSEKNAKNVKPVQASIGSLIEALYDAVPKTIRSTEHKTLLVILALKDLQPKIRPA